LVPPEVPYGNKKKVGVVKAVSPETKLRSSITKNGLVGKKCGATAGRGGEL